jgi:hypothetical protein
MNACGILLGKQERDRLEDQDVDNKSTLEKDRMDWDGLDSSDLGPGSVSGSCGRGNEY